MNRLILILMMMAMLPQLNAQTIVLKQTVPEDFEDEDLDFGPNRRHFDHPYTGFGLVVGGFDHEGDTLPPTKFGNSFYVASGSRFYKNFNSLLARTIDYEISYEQHALNLGKDTTIGLPVANTDLKKAKYWVVKIGLAWSYQFNFKPKRGNQLGTYLSFGAYGDYLVLRRFSSVYESNVSNYAENVHVNLGRIKYFNKWDYGALVRFGKTNWSLFVKYRYANYFKDKSSYDQFKELPRFVVGLNFFPGNI